MSKGIIVKNIQDSTSQWLLGHHDIRMTKKKIIHINQLKEFGKGDPLEEPSTTKQKVLNDIGIFPYRFTRKPAIRSHLPVVVATHPVFLLFLKYWLISSNLFLSILFNRKYSLNFEIPSLK